MLLKDKHREDEAMENARKNSTSRNGKTTRVSGEALKSKIKSGQIPI